MPKTDYYDDPAAPRANSLVMAVTAVVLDDAGRVLLIQRTDNGLWAVPVGAQEVGETLIEAAVREETGLDIEATALIGICSDPRHVIAYDEVRRESLPLLPYPIPSAGNSRRAASPSTCTGSNPTAWTS